MFSNTRNRLFAIAIVPGLSLVLAACGGSDMAGHDMNSSKTTTTVAAAADHNDQDVTFAQMMIVHHQGAIDMAKMAKTQASSAEVKALASRIEAAQGPEINTMTSWLTSWNQPTTLGEHSEAMHSMPGAMSASDMNALTKATGTGFDRQFLTMMTEHHNGAIEMARTEQSSGKYQSAKDLAATIITSQTAEVAEMQNLLTGLPAS